MIEINWVFLSIQTADTIWLYCAYIFLIQRNRSDSDPEYADSNMSETVKDEAAFEDKMVDTMVLEDPQNMYQALEKWVDQQKRNSVSLHEAWYPLMKQKRSISWSRAKKARLAACGKNNKCNVINWNENI